MNEADIAERIKAAGEKIPVRPAPHSTTLAPEAFRQRVRRRTAIVVIGAAAAVVAAGLAGVIVRQATTHVPSSSTDSTVAAEGTQDPNATPEPTSPPTGPSSGINAFGQTYGPMDTGVPIPDLVAVTGINGLSGYVYATDGPPEWTGEPERPDRYVGVYESDGSTLIDHYFIQDGGPVADESFTVNEYGQTIGTLNDVHSAAVPDLVGAMTDDGVEGYVYVNDISWPNAANPDEAAVLMHRYTTRRWTDKQGRPHAVFIAPVYAIDGRTQVGLSTRGESRCN